MVSTSNPSLSTRSTNGAPISGVPNGSTGVSAPAGDVMERVVQGAHETIDRLAETAAPHVERIQSGVRDANDKLHERAAQANEVREEWTENLRNTVRDNPIATVFAALAVGAIIARITR